MAKTYLVTKTDFDSAIGADDTAGLRGRIATNETAVGNDTSGLVKKTNDIESSVGATAAEGLRKKTADLEATVGLDDTSGLRKDMIDVKADIGADNTTGLRKRSADLEATVGTDDTKGLRKRVIDLEDGGVATMKYRTHSASDVYEEGEVVQKDGSLYESNSAIDGSVTPVAFVEGVNNDQWTLVGKKPDNHPILIENGSYKTDILNQSNYGLLVSSMVDVDGSPQGGTLLFDNARGAVTFNKVGSVNNVKSQQDLITKADGDTLYQAKSLATTAELNYLDGVTSNVQDQLDNTLSKDKNAFATWAVNTRSSSWETIISTTHIDIEVRRDSTSDSCIRVKNKRGITVYDFYSEQQTGLTESSSGSSVSANGYRTFNADTSAAAITKRVKGAFSSTNGNTKNNSAAFYEVYYRTQRVGTSPNYSYFTFVSASVWSF